MQKSFPRKGLRSARRSVSCREARSIAHVQISETQTCSMFLRALLAFAACPGIVALMVPALIALGGKRSAVVHPAGFVLLTIGVALLLWCVRDFYVAGKGTLAPWDPPRSLVVVGLYRWSRNPMYVAVTLTLLGWAVAYASRSLLIYAVAIMTAFHLRVVYAEEPWLARTHGVAWDEYRSQVRRWVGRNGAETGEGREDKPPIG